MAKFASGQVLLFLLINARSGLVAGMGWSVCISKSCNILCITFSWTDSGLYIYYFFSMLHSLILQWKVLWFSLEASFSLKFFFHWSLNDNRSLLVFRTLLIIQDDFNSAVILMIILLLISCSTSIFSRIIKKKMELVIIFKPPMSLLAFHFKPTSLGKTWIDLYSSSYG